MKQILIRKNNGDLVPFNPEKIKSTCLRAGASEELATKIANNVASKIYRGVKTKEIMRMALRLLDKEHPAVAARYNLREAIYRLGPAGFDFEKYIAALLRAYGYKAKLPPILHGACIDHEVDILAEQNGCVAMIECKLRQSSGIFITIKDVMSTWARFLDLVDGSATEKCPHLDEVWIITNSKISYDGAKYGNCKKMSLLSWDNPRERPLPAWIDDKALYPITVLRGLDKISQGAFARAGLLLVRDLIRVKSEDIYLLTRLPKRKIESFIVEAKAICELSKKK